jgi:ribose 5-phosphate isomerase A
MPTQTIAKTQAQAAALKLAPPKDPMAPYKKAAAEAAVRHYVRPGMRLGLGTGSTMKFAIDLLGKKHLHDVVSVPTSELTASQARGLGVALTDLEHTPTLDLAIDGADEVAKVGNQFYLIKGMGGALLREKEVARQAKKYVVVVDDSKLVKKLGSKSPLPVEVDRRSWRTVARQIEALGGEPVLRPDPDTGEPYVTDNGNYIVSVHWPHGIDHPKELAHTLDQMKGVKAHGLFLGMADEVVVASSKGIRRLKKTDRKVADLFSRKAPVAVAPESLRDRHVLAKRVRHAEVTGTPLLEGWLEDVLPRQAAVVAAATTMMAARKRIADAQAKGENPLPPIDREHLPQSEEEAVELLMHRVGLTAAERRVVKKGLDALARGGLPPPVREPIGGHSSFYSETFRTQMAITDPGIDHLAMTLADPRMLEGNFVHMEIIDRDTEHMAPYSNPGPKTLALVRMMLGTDAPSTVFFGRPNYIASTLQDTVPGFDTASAGLKFNLPTAANWMANAARAALNIGYSEAKFGMDGLSPEEVVILGQAVHSQANLQEGEYISAAFNLNAVLKDFNLVPEDAPQISGAPSPEQRGKMLVGALQSIDAARQGGFRKVTVDSASMKPPSYPLIEYFSAENLMRWAHHAHELGLETYGSGGMRDYHFPLLQLCGLDGVGVGFSIHEPPDPKTPGKAGRLLPEKVLSEVEMRDAAEKTPVGRAAVLMRMLDEKKFDGTLTVRQAALREDTFEWMTGLAHEIDKRLDLLKAARDSAVTAAAAMSATDKKAAEGAAKQAFEEGFKALIDGSLHDAGTSAAAKKLLERGLRLEVKA